MLGLRGRRRLMGIKGYYLDERATDAAGTPDPEVRRCRRGGCGSRALGTGSCSTCRTTARNGQPWTRRRRNWRWTKALFGFSTMNDTGGNAPPGNAYAGNRYAGRIWKEPERLELLGAADPYWNQKVSPRPIDLPLKTAAIKPDATLPVEIPAGSVTFDGSTPSPLRDLAWWPSRRPRMRISRVTFGVRHETITGDFDKIVKVSSITSGPVTDPVDAQAAGGLEVRVSTDSLSPSFMINAANPLGANQILVTGRGDRRPELHGVQPWISRVDKALPNQWLRLRRVGDYFSAYVGTDGLTWSLVGQRYQQWPATLLVGAYSFSASYVVTDEWAPAARIWRRSSSPTTAMR